MCCYPVNSIVWFYTRTTKTTILTHTIKAIITSLNNKAPNKCPLGQWIKYFIYWLLNHNLKNFQKFSEWSGELVRNITSFYYEWHQFGNFVCLTKHYFVVNIEIKLTYRYFGWLCVFARPRLIEHVEGKCFIFFSSLDKV